MLRLSRLLVVEVRAAAVALAGCAAKHTDLSGLDARTAHARGSGQADSAARRTREPTCAHAGMITHHAQAVVMARWAPSHGARSDVRILAARIDIAQRDEIAFMQRWLRARREQAPDVEHALAGHDMATHGDLMPGMLTAQQLARLDSARGSEFDRVFLTFMMQHHEGAITMVKQLFGSQGAAQDVYVFRFASDVEAINHRDRSNEQGSRVFPSHQAMTPKRARCTLLAVGSLFVASCATTTSSAIDMSPCAPSLARALDAAAGSTW